MCENVDDVKDRECVLHSIRFSGSNKEMKKGQSLPLHRE